MIRSRVLLAVGLGLVALLALTALAGAKGKPKAAKGPAPDLVVAKLSKPAASQLTGAKLRVVVQVRNKGTAKAGKSRVAVYLAKGKKHTAKDRRLGRRGVRALRPGRKAKAKLTLALPTGAAPGRYRLIACADDGKRVREARERGNCAASARFELRAPVSGSAAPAFTMTDGVDWGFVRGPNPVVVSPGDPVTVTMREANGIAGQAGYTQAAVAPAPLLTGATTTLGFGDNVDDGVAALDLPFAFPFGGVSEQAVSVSTNGWISFGAPAWDFWDNGQTRDYRGVPAVVGETVRGLMPYWGDLDLEERGAGPGEVRQVLAADGSAVAFQWDTGHHTAGGSPRRLLQVVLFRDGSFRFDYPGMNAAGGGKSFVGYSPGTGPGSAGIVSVEGDAVPGSSVLFTPKPVSATAALPAGRATATLPAGSQFVAATPGCVVAVAPSAFTAGLASCPVPPLASGQQATQSVTFSMPPRAPGHQGPANFRLLGSYLATGVSLQDGDEINALDAILRPSTIALEPELVTAQNPTAGTAALFRTNVDGNPGGLDEPTIAFTLPANASLRSVRIDETDIDCSPPSGATVACRLPSGFSFVEVDVEVIPTAAAVGSVLTLGVSAQARNAPPVSASVSSQVVEAP